jgi:hypothetical protein
MPAAEELEDLSDEPDCEKDRDFNNKATSSILMPSSLVLGELQSVILSVSASEEAIESAD